MTGKPVLHVCAVAFLTLVGLAGARAHADSPRFPAAPPAYLAECGSCHVAYPPGLLTAGDWRTTLRGLARHFGTDATLGAAEMAVIQPYLEANAAPLGGRHGAQRQPPRLTQTPWFERKHLRKLPAAIWTDPKVKSAANCTACHAGAESGRYGESEISVPGFPGRHW